MIPLLAVSLTVQLVAIGLALRLTKPTRREIGWAFVSFALVLMGFRRATTFYLLLTDSPGVRADLAPELIAMAVSLCMIFAMILLGPFLQSARQIDESLSKKEGRLHAIIEAVPDLLFVFDDDGMFLEVISTHDRGLDLTRESYIGKNIREFMAPEQAEHFVGTMREAARSREMQVVEYEVVRNGVTKWWESRMVMLGDREILVMGRDITDRKRAEDSRLRLEGKLQQAQKMECLGVLSGGIAHDFNNLLTGVLGNASLAIMKLPGNSPAMPCLSQIEIAAQRAGELTKQLLAYAGKGRFVVQPVSLATIVEEMADLLRTVISKKATLKLDFEPNLPNINADATQVRQIVMNLITNASDSLGETSGVIGLHTGVMVAERAYLHSMFVESDVAEGTYVFLEVTDSGAGMTDEVMRNIFDPFFTTKFTGRGLGLAAVLGIVRGHKGAIKVYSEPK